MKELAKAIARKAAIIKSSEGKVDEAIALTAKAIIKEKLDDSSIIQLLKELNKNGFGLMSNDISSISVIVEAKMREALKQEVYMWNDA